MINGQAEERSKSIVADKEILFQEFVKKMQHDFPSFSKRAAAMTAPGALDGLPLPANETGGPFMEAIKNKLVEMKKVAAVNDCKQAFIRGLRDQSRIEIFLERPALLHLDLTPGDDPWLGSKDAPVTIQVFIDFQCPYCKKAISTLKDLLAKKEGNIRIVARDFPLPSHPDAAMAARAAACADDQDRYWEYHDLLFDNQQELDVTSLRGYAAALGLDTTRFDRCLEDGSGKAEVEKDVSTAALSGINSAPGIIINGFYLSGSPSLDYLEEVIADIEKGRAPLAEYVPGNG
jgi:protein-disulfide isomerase